MEEEAPAAEGAVVVSVVLVDGAEVRWSSDESFDCVDMFRAACNRNVRAAVSVLLPAAVVFIGVAVDDASLTVAAAAVVVSVVLVHGAIEVRWSSDESF